MLELKQDITTIDYGIICHQVNCMGVMGAGLAKTIRYKWPTVYADYCQVANSKTGLQLGMVITTQVERNVVVASLCGQRFYGRDKRYTDYEAMCTCLRNLMYLNSNNNWPIYIPYKMGCNLAGGDWEVVQRIIAGEVPSATIVHPQETKDIPHFGGKYRWLSNFWPSPIIIRLKGEFVTFPTVEHFYQAMKTNSLDIQKTIAKISSPGDAKRMGKKLVIRHDWEAIKVSVMQHALRIKFSQPDLRSKLLATGDVRLVEGNNWGDTFWGVCQGEGQNTLGRLIMEIRDEIRRSS